MSQNEFYFNNFSRFKSSGLRDLKAGRHEDARYKLLKAAEYLFKLATETREEKIKKSRIENANKLVSLARSIEKAGASAGGRIKDSEDGPDDEKRFVRAERPAVDFDDVAGLEDVKEQVRLKMLYPFKHPEIAKKFGVSGGGGVLLFGPPGTGKTLIARAIAGEIDAAFYTVKPSEIMSKWVGEAEQNIQKLFEEARSNERSIIFIDEIEALVPKRASSQSSVMARVVPQILAEMEGFDAKKGDGNALLFIGATNEPWSLDPAVLRPGRFDELIHVGLPDFEARKRILEIHLSKRPLADDVDLEELAAMLEGYSGADIKNICEKAAAARFIEAVEKKSDLPIARKDVTAILESTRPSVKPKDADRYLRYLEN